MVLQLLFMLVSFNFFSNILISIRKLFCFFFLFPLVGVGQTYYKCATDEMNRRYSLENNREEDSFQDTYKIPENSNYVIPVVFHVNDPTNPQKVTYAQIQSAMNILNEDFNANNPEFNSLDPLFQSIAANVGVTFCLASVDPDGNSTNGVTYHYNDYHGMDPLLKSLSVWPCNQYLNIWIVNEPFDDGSIYQSGYATFPSTFNANQGTDGIVYNHRYLGYGLGSSSISSPSHWQAFMARVLTHEVGHYLHLYHTFQGACSTPGDQVADTPPVNFFGSSTHSCPDASLICAGYNAVNDENFMDYSQCYSMFTEGQKIRMIDALNSSNGYRNNLWSSSNLNITGCSNATDIESLDFIQNKKLLRVIDVLGRQVDKQEDMLFFYIYDDGTVDKRIVVE